MARNHTPPRGASKRDATKTKSSPAGLPESKPVPDPELDAIQGARAVFLRDLFFLVSAKLRERAVRAAERPAPRAALAPDALVLRPGEDDGEVQGAAEGLVLDAIFRGDLAAALAACDKLTRLVPSEQQKREAARRLAAYAARARKLAAALMTAADNLERSPPAIRGFQARIIDAIERAEWGFTGEKHNHAAQMYFVRMFEFEREKQRMEAEARADPPKQRRAPPVPGACEAAIRAHWQKVDEDIATALDSRRREQTAPEPPSPRDRARWMLANVATRYPEIASRAPRDKVAELFATNATQAIFVDLAWRQLSDILRAVDLPISPASLKTQFYTWRSRVMAETATNQG